MLLSKLALQHDWKRLLAGTVCRGTVRKFPVTQAVGRSLAPPRLTGKAGAL